jgi:hypothetical protein
MDANLEKKLREIEVAIAKQTVEDMALRDLILGIGKHVNLSPLDLMKDLQKQRAIHWDSFLRDIENSRPDLDEIPTEEEPGG